jgi:hypothetical protein
MLDQAQVYAQEVHDRFEREVVWLPDEIVEVGAVGHFVGHVFYQDTTLNREFGINLPVETDSTSRSQYNFESDGVTEGDVAVSAKGVPTAVGQVSAALQVSFSKENSVYVRLENCVGTRFASMVKLGEAILNLVRLGQWDPRYAVVTRVTKAGAATVIQSSSKNASITLEAKNSGPIAKALAVAGKVRWRDVHSIGCKVIAQGNVTPLVTVGMVQYHILPWRKPTFESVALQHSYSILPWRTTAFGSLRMNHSRLTSLVGTIPGIDLLESETPTHLDVKMRLPKYGDEVDVGSMVDYVWPLLAETEATELSPVVATLEFKEIQTPSRYRAAAGISITEG